MDLYDYVKVEFRSSKPIYQQLMEGFENFSRVHEKEFSLPPERKMASDLGVSRNALRQAVRESCRRGWLVQRWGKGVYTDHPRTFQKILLIVPGNMEISMPWNYMIPGIEERAQELGISVEKISTFFLRCMSEKNIDCLYRDPQFTGILHLDYLSWREAKELGSLRKLAKPVLFPHVSYKWIKMESFPMNLIDEKVAFRLAAEELCRHGHKRILSLVSDNELIRGRTDEEHLHMLGEIGADPSRALLCKTTLAEAENVLHNLFEQNLFFSAVLCFSDFFAIHAIKACHEHQLRIPEDISVMGFCGYPGGHLLTPPLTTIDFGYHSIGKNAVDRLLRIPDNWQDYPDEQIEYSSYQLVSRASVQRCRQPELKERSKNETRIIMSV